MRYALRCIYAGEIVLYIYRYLVPAIETNAQAGSEKCVFRHGVE